MAVYHVLMIEDEPAEATRLSELLHRYTHERDINISVTHETSAEHLGELSPKNDLVLLDIELPGITGMEAAKLLRTQAVDTPIIFITNLAQMAIEGYTVDALDFVVKPVAYSDLCMALDKALRVIERDTGVNIVVQKRSDTAIIPRNKLIYAEVDGHEVSYHVQGWPEPVQTRDTLSAVATRLEEGPFIQISSSCVIALGHIKRVKRDTIVMDDGSEHKFSRRKQKEAMARITEYLGRTL